jgi:hypothetical protein
MMTLLMIPAAIFFIWLLPMANLAFKSASLSLKFVSSAGGNVETFLFLSNHVVN